MLLLLDNLEQVIEAAPELSALLASCPKLSLIVTSRELLRVQGEVEYPVSPLADADAVRLFCKRAQTEQSMEVVELCRRLDNLPLAVELAAARMKALSPAQILERVSKRLDLLQGGRDADPRQLTLRTTIEWSYDLLSAEEQQLFRSLSVFAGGCTLEAAEVVCDADLEALQSLIEKSLVRFANERYLMLETIRDYARERLEAQGAHEAVQRHAEYFLALAEKMEPELTGANASVSMTLLAADHDNLRAARERFRKQGDGEREIRLATTVWPFLMGRGYLSEGRTWLEEALSGLGGLLPGERTKALFGAAILAIWQGEYEHGRRFAEESLALARGLGDAPSVARALDALALAAKEQGHYAQAASLFEECRELSREIGDDWLLSIAVSNLGDVALNEGEYVRATALFEESLTLGRKRNDRERIARSLVNLATAHLAEGCDERALVLFKEGLGHSAEADLIEVVGWGLEGVAAVAAARGDTERAATLLGKTEAMRKEMGAAQPHFEKARNERILAALGKQLGLDALSAATADGRNMPLEDALTLAFHYE
jgi:predicted ATPase